ncbi:MAG: surface-adhesin E family protein [Quisquiliibacterium sp.]
MKKRLIGLICALVVCAATAKERQWNFVGADPRKRDVKLFVDVANIERLNGQVQVWSLLQNGEAGSSIGRSDIECKTGQARSLQWTTYEGKMGTGKVLASNSRSGDWFYVGSGSLLSMLLRVACR